MNLPRKIVFLAAGAAFSLCELGAQWGHAPDVQMAIASGFDTSVFDPVMVADGTGGFFMAWQERRDGVVDIYAQRVDANGNGLWQEDGVPVCTNSFQQDAPSIVLDGAGGVIVFWADNRVFDDGRHHFFAQRLDGDGNTLWAVDGIRVCLNDAEQEWFGSQSAAVVSRPGGGAAIVWLDARGRPDISTQIYAQALDLSGARVLGDDGFAIATDSQTHKNLQAVPVAGGEIMILWLGNAGVTRAALLSNPATVVDALPARIGSDNLRAVSDGAGGVFLAVLDDFLSSGDIGLWAQRVFADLSLPWGTDGVLVNNNIESDANAEMELATDGQGNLYVVWQTRLVDDQNVYLRRVGGDGTVHWSENGIVVADTADDEDMPRVLADSGGVFVVWRTGDDKMLKAQRYDPDGNAVWAAPADVASYNFAGSYEDLSVVSDESGGFIVGFRGGARPDDSFLDASAKRVLPDGSFPKSQLINVSTRGFVGADTEQLIGGFVIQGTGTKKVLIRGVGPTLAGFGVTDAIADPSLKVFTAAGALVAENDNWGAETNAAEIATTTVAVGAFGLEAGGKDAALLLELEPGSYTAIVGGVGGATGVGIVEIYDAQPEVGTLRLVNVSTRGFVGTGDGIMIPGFVISGNATMRMLIRGVGPTLGTLGVAGALANPQLEVRADGMLVAENDNWSIPNSNVTTVSESVAFTGAFELDAGSDDAAVVVIAGPGTYTVPTSGVAEGTGVGLVEAYESF